MIILWLLRSLSSVILDLKASCMINVNWEMKRYYFI